jgi:hypothetical protein
VAVNRNGHRERPEQRAHAPGRNGYRRMSWDSKQTTYAKAWRLSPLIVNVLQERCPPFSSEAVTAEFAAVLKPYRVLTVTGDRHGDEWPRECFQTHEFVYTVGGARSSASKSSSARPRIGPRP